MLKQKINQSLSHLISAINKAYKKRQRIIFFKASSYSTITPVLQLLLNNGLILSFKNYNNLAIIKLNINSKEQLSATPYNSIKLNKLISEQRRNGSIYVLNTDKGLLTSLKALEKNTGGRLIMKIC